MLPKISVLMSVHNGERYLVASVSSILAQTCPEFEFIIVDDGSMDNTPSILSSFSREEQRVQIITNSTRKGLTASLNIGLRYCTGEYVARMDADDISQPDRLKKQLEYMQQHREVALCGSQGRLIDEVGKAIGEKILPQGYDKIRRRLLFNNQFIHSSWFFRRSVVEELGGYDESFPRSQDYELVLRLAACHKVVNLPDQLVDWRVSERSLSWADKRQEWDAIRARWLAVTRYGYPKLVGVANIALRIFWLLAPQFWKRRRYSYCKIS